MTRAHWNFVCLVLALLISVAVFGASPDVSPSGSPSVSLGTITGKTATLKTGGLTSTATTADQVVLSYTVTAGKILYLEYFDLSARLTTYGATATNFGNCSLESPAGTKLYTQMVANAGAPLPAGAVFAEPIPIPGGAVVRLVCTPSAVTSFTWLGNFGGFER